MSAAPGPQNSCSQLDTPGTTPLRSSFSSNSATGLHCQPQNRVGKYRHYHLPHGDCLSSVRGFPLGSGEWKSSSACPEIRQDPPEENRLNWSVLEEKKSVWWLAAVYTDFERPVFFPRRLILFVFRGTNIFWPNGIEPTIVSCLEDSVIWPLAISGGWVVVN